MGAPGASCTRRTIAHPGQLGSSPFADRRMAIGRVTSKFEKTIMRTTMSGTARYIPTIPQRNTPYGQREQHDHRAEIEPTGYEAGLDDDAARE